MIETPFQGQARILKSGNTLEVKIPTKKNWPVIIFLTAWMGGWVMGEIFAISTLFFGSTPLLANAFLLFWLTGWTVGGLFFISVLLWMVAGKEIIKIENGIIEIGREVFSLKRSKKYHIHEVRHLCINISPENDLLGLGYQKSLFGLKGGILKFDYGMKTLQFANNIDEAEARLLIATFKTNLNFKEENFG